MNDTVNALAVALDFSPGRTWRAEFRSSPYMVDQKRDPEIRPQWSGSGIIWDYNIDPHMPFRRKIPVGHGPTFAYA